MRIAENRINLLYTTNTTCKTEPKREHSPSQKPLTDPPGSRRKDLRNHIDGFELDSKTTDAPGKTKVMRSLCLTAKARKTREVSLRARCGILLRGGSHRILHPWFVQLLSNFLSPKGICQTVFLFTSPADTNRGKSPNHVDYKGSLFFTPNEPQGENEVASAMAIHPISAPLQRPKSKKSHQEHPPKGTKIMPTQVTTQDVSDPSNATDVISRDHQKTDPNDMQLDALVLIARLSRMQRREGWEDLGCIASLRICEEPCLATRRHLIQKLWGAQSSRR